MNLQYDGLFTIPVVQRIVSDMEDFNKTVMDGLDDFMKKNENRKPINWSCDLYTSDIQTNLINHELFSELESPILNHAHEFCDIIGYDDLKFTPKIVDCWLNVYGPTHNQEIHNHPNTHICGIYYPTASELDGNLVFRSPLFDTNFNMIPLKKLNNSNTGYFDVKTETSKMVLFPGYLLHCVRPNQSDRRVSISFNIMMVN